MGCIYIIDGVEYNEAQLKEYLAENLEAFSNDLGLSDVEAEARGIIRAANDIRRNALKMEEYDPEGITIAEVNKEAERLLIEGYDVNKMLNRVEKNKNATPLETEMLKILMASLDEEIKNNPTDELINKQKRLIEITDLAGTEAGRRLAFRKGMAEPMSTISEFYVDKMNRNQVDKLTDAQKAEAKADFEEIQKADQAIDALKKQVEDYSAKELAQAEIDQAKNAPKVKRDYAEERKAVVKDIISKWKNASKGGDMLTAVPIPYSTQMAAIAPDVLKLARLFVEEGADKLDDVVSKVHGVLKEAIDGLTKKDVQDIIGGKYSKAKESKTELQIKYEDLRKEAKLLSEIEEVKAGKPKTEKEAVRQNQRLTALRKELQQAKSEAGYYDDMPENRLKAAIKKVELNSEAIKKRIEDGDYSPVEKRQSLLENRELRKKNPELFNKYLDAIDKRDAIKHEYEVKMAEEEINSKEGFQRIAAKAGKIGKEGFNTIKALKAGIDNSAVFVQNGIAVINPFNIKATKEALKAQINVFASEGNFRRRLVEIHENKPLWNMIEQSGLDIIDPKGFRQSLREEQFGGKNWLDRLKVKFKGKEYKASMVTAPFERIFAAFSNEFRLQLFIKGAERLINQGKTIENSTKEYQDLASYINNISGRGKVHESLKQAEPVISGLVWAPKLMASSLNIMGLGDVVNLGKTKGYYRNMTPQMRKYAIQQTAAGIGTGVLIMALASMQDDTEVDYDPESVTFGQIKNTKTGWSVNLFGRLTPYVRYLTMMTMAGKKINGKPVKFEPGKETYKFFRGKMAPATGIGFDLALRKDFQGKRYSLDDKAKIASDLFEPLFINELRKQIEIDGTSAILSKGIPTFYGLKVSNEKMYDQRDLPTLLRQTQDSKSMDKTFIYNFNDNGREINKEEFNTFVKQRDELIGKYMSIIHDKGVPVIEGEKVVIKPISEVSKEDLIKEINRLKTLATKRTKEALFGEKPEIESDIKEDLDYAREDLGIGREEEED